MVEFSQKKCIPCQGGIPPLGKDEIKGFLKLVDDKWHVSNDIKLIKEFLFNNYNEAIKFSNLVAQLAISEDHHPYIHINFKTVEIILFTHKINGLHENDFLMANKIDKIYK